MLWQVALILHVNLQGSVARYNALYSGFAAIPIFLVWFYVSWLAVLVGAQIAASHQFERNTRQAMRAKHVDQHLTETLAVGVAGQLTRRFIDGRGPIAGAELAAGLEVPPPVLEQLPDRLVDAGIVLRVMADREVGYAPARDPDQVRLADLRRAVRCDPRGAEIRRVVEGRLGPGLRDLLEREQAEQLAVNPTLRELAELMPPPAPASPREGRVPKVDWHAFPRGPSGPRLICDRRVASRPFTLARKDRSPKSIRKRANRIKPDVNLQRRRRHSRSPVTHALAAQVTNRPKPGPR